MGYDNNQAINRIISLLEQLFQVMGSGEGASSNVTVSNQITGFNLEATQQDVLTELQNLLAELIKSKDFITTPLIDSGNSNQLIFRKEVLEETSGTYVISYEDINGGVVVPIGPIASLENLLVTNTQEITKLNNSSLNATIPLGFKVYEDFNSQSGNKSSYTITENQERAPIIKIDATQAGSFDSQSRLEMLNSNELTSFVISNVTNPTNYRISLSIQDSESYGAIELVLNFDSNGAYTTGSLETYDNVNFNDYTPNLIFTTPPTATSQYHVQFIKSKNLFNLWVNYELAFSIVVDDFVLLNEKILLDVRVGGNTSTHSLSVNQVVTNNTTPILLDLNNKLSLTDRSFSSVAGSTQVVSSEIFPKNRNRKYLLIQNISDTDIWINFTDPATIGGGSLKLIPNGSYELSSTSGGYINIESVNVICSTVGKEFTAKEA